MLTCPICGKEYFCESKVCKECEDYLKYSGLANLTDINENRNIYSYKWNCAVFLKDKNFVFATKLRPKMYVEITSEPFNLRIAPARHYELHSETATKFRYCIETSSRESDIAANSELIDDIMKVVKERSDSLLIYE